MDRFDCMISNDMSNNHSYCLFLQTKAIRHRELPRQKLNPKLPTRRTHPNQVRWKATRGQQGRLFTRLEYRFKSKQKWNPRSRRKLPRKLDLKLWRPNLSRTTSSPRRTRKLSLKYRLTLLLIRSKCCSRQPVQEVAPCAAH